MESTTSHILKSNFNFTARHFSYQNSPQRSNFDLNLKDFFILNKNRHRRYSRSTKLNSS